MIVNKYNIYITILITNNMEYLLETCPEYIQELVGNLSEDYESSITEALSERGSYNDPYSFDIADCVETLFTEKCDKYENVESDRIIPMNVNSKEIRRQLKKWSKAIQDPDNLGDDIEKEDFVDKIRNVSCKVGESVLENDSLEDAEKSVINVNIVLCGKFLVSTLEHSEEIQNMNRPSGKSKSWLKSHEDEIDCTINKFVNAVSNSVGSISIDTSCIIAMAISLVGVYNIVRCWTKRRE
ncbi:MAG: hypothetical protein LBJ39_04795 [Tannerellaceae bacterium]|jgi:hypothetical protein|nr:hypothetical protein [Tannerellaceae bacterium]